MKMKKNQDLNFLNGMIYFLYYKSIEYKIFNKNILNLMIDLNPIFKQDINEIIINTYLLSRN